MEAVWFFAGGYLVPAFYFGALVFIEDRKDGKATWFESAFSGIVSGLLWPFNDTKIVPKADK